MDLKYIESFINDFLQREPLNFLPLALGGHQIIAEAICGAANADDPWFNRLDDEPALGGFFQKPGVWLAGAKTVISIFFVFSPKIRDSNSPPVEVPLPWLYGRVEGGDMVIPQVIKNLADEFDKHGIRAAVPVQSPGFEVKGGLVSNWSERHVAFIAGLGTFGRSCGILTAKGAAGRLGSLVIDAAWPATPRPYEGLYDYCLDCGACQSRCPKGAINQEGKDHILCKEMINHTKELYKPRYGCGKCQTQVPCEAGLAI